MSLKPGTTGGPYEIVVLIRLGGMGEVYRARNSRFHRDCCDHPTQRICADF
jgi:hypothetical protein